MKKYILLLLLATFSIQAQTLQNPTYGNVKLKNNVTDNSATKVNVQSTDGTINTISKSDLVNVVEVNDVPSLPLVGEVGKIYVVKNVNKIYRWNGTFYQELAYTDISGLQAQIDLKANDSDVVKLTGNQTISGQKSFSLTGKIDMQTNNAFPAISVTSLGSNGQSAAEFINNSSFPNSTALRLRTGSSGGVGNMALSVSNQSTIGTGIFSNASNGGVSISSQSGNGDSYVSNITSGGAGRNYVGRNDGAETYSVDKTGNVIGNSYIKRSTPANNILLAGGTDITQASLPVSTATQTALNNKENAFTKNTAFNKNFGTTAGTVVEGGTLGSNAYSSTAYLPINDGARVVLDYNTKLTSGFYNSDDPNINNPSGQSYSQLIVAHGIDTGLQIAGGFQTDNLHFRGWSGNGSNFSPWRRLWHDGNFNPANYLPLTGGVVTGNISATLYSGGATLTGTPTAPTATAGTNTTQIATTAFVLENSSARPYKVYTALLTQGGTGAPTATVLENTLGGTVVWSYVSIGQYRGTLTGAFLSNKTVVFLTNVYGKYFLTGGRENDNSVMIGTQAPIGGSTNGDLSNSSIEIRVYN